MTRLESDIEERPEPSLIYFRRGNGKMQPEMMVVEKGKVTVYPIPMHQLPELLASIAGYVATEMAKR